VARARRKTRWFCTRQSKGVKCNTWNPIRTQKCHICDKPKPAVKKPKHMAALNESYEHYIEINREAHGVGEVCAICGRPPVTRKLDRDHTHTTRGFGEPRGLLCAMHNKFLPYWMTLELAESIADYLRRHEARMADLRAITDDDWEGEEVA
jgi:hypothetical protein